MMISRFFALAVAALSLWRGVAGDDCESLESGYEIAHIMKPAQIELELKANVDVKECSYTLELTIIKASQYS